MIFIPRENGNDAIIRMNMARLFLLGFLRALCASAVKWSWQIGKSELPWGRRPAPSSPQKI
jgi:hypothetical protein